MLPQQYTISSWQDQKRGEWIAHYQMCSHLVSASSSLSRPETLMPQMMVHYSKLSSTTTGCWGCKLYKHWLHTTHRTHTWLHTHTAPTPPPSSLLPPACAILPTATLGKIIRWLADILSIFLSWLRVRLAGCLLIDVLTDFFFPGVLPWFARLWESKYTGTREGLTNAKQFIKIRHKASIRGDGCCLSVPVVSPAICRKEMVHSSAVILSRGKQCWLMLRTPCRWLIFQKDALRLCSWSAIWLIYRALFMSWIYKEAMNK